MNFFLVDNTKSKDSSSFKFTEMLTQTLTQEFGENISADQIRLIVTFAANLLNTQKDILPKKILEVVVFSKTTDLDKYLFFAEPNGIRIDNNETSESILNKLLDSEREDVLDAQVRLFASTIESFGNDLTPFKTLRVISPNQKSEYDNCKIQIEEYITSVLKLPEPEDIYDSYCKIM